MNGIELYKCKEGKTLLVDKVNKNYVDINFKHFLKKKYVNVDGFRLWFKGWFNKMYEVSIKMPICYNIDTLEMYDLDPTYFGYGSSIRDMGYDDADCRFFNDVFENMLQENNWGKDTDFSVSIWDDCFNKAVEKTRVNKEDFEYYFYFETLNEMLDFIRYYDSVGDDVNILDEYYHLIFMKNKDYNNYLKTKYWKQKRQKVLKAAKYKCQLCSNKEKLHVHHNTYENIGSEKKEDLIVLCEKCHKKFHDK